MIHRNPRHSIQLVLASIQLRRVHVVVDWYVQWSASLACVEE